MTRAIEEVAMCKPVIGVGGLFILIAVAILFAPGLVVDGLDWGSPGGQYLAGGMRLGIGLVLALFAPSTRYPKGLRIFGALLIVAGIGILFVPNEFWAGLMQYWLDENLMAFRIGGAVVCLLFGGLLVHAGRPEGATLEQE